VVSSLLEMSNLSSLERPTNEKLLSSPVNSLKVNSILDFREIEPGTARNRGSMLGQGEVQNVKNLAQRWSGWGGIRGKRASGRFHGGPHHQEDLTGLTRGGTFLV